MSSEKALVQKAKAGDRDAFAALVSAYEGKIYNLALRYLGNREDAMENIFMCTKRKGELGLDYETSVFVDDNPKELVSLFNAGVSSDRLFRIKRDGAGYSDVIISEFEAKEYTNLNDIEI